MAANTTHECIALNYTITNGSERLKPIYQTLTAKITAKQITLSEALISGRNYGRKVFKRSDVILHEVKGQRYMIFENEKTYAMEPPQDHYGTHEWTLILFKAGLHVARRIMPVFKAYKRNEYTTRDNGYFTTHFRVYESLWSSLCYDRTDVQLWSNDIETIFTIHSFVKLHRHLCIDYGFTQNIASASLYTLRHEPILLKDFKTHNPFIEPTIMAACKARREFCVDILKEALHPKRVEYIINTYGFDAWANQDDGY